jgi:serine protease Do
MKQEQELIDLLDRYAQDKLTREEQASLEKRMLHDDDFRHQAEQHLALIGALKFYEGRKKLYAILDAAHQEIENPLAVVSTPPSAKPGWKKYWPITAMAASVALISVVGTFVFIRSVEHKQTAIYKELRRNVEQIKKSQKMMMDDLAKEKKKNSPGNYAGTGFLISANGYLTTSYHVVKEADSIYIENEKFGSRKAVVVLSDPANDISILKIEQDSEMNLLLPYLLSKNETSLAEEVYTLGFPREDIVFGAGSISAMTGYDGNPNAYQVSVPVNPGNSGGPLLNQKGDLVGIISGVQTQTSGVAFAIKSTVLLDVIINELLDTLSKPVMLPKQNLMKNTSRVEQVKRWKDYVFMVKVYKN